MEIPGWRREEGSRRVAGVDAPEDTSEVDSLPSCNQESHPTSSPAPCSMTYSRDELLPICVFLYAGQRRHLRLRPNRIYSKNILEEVKNEGHAGAG